MQMIPYVELEKPEGHPVVQSIRHDYERMSAEDFKDKPARLTKRQAVFLRNLITLAHHLQSRSIPMEFHLETVGNLHLDRGCVKIAEHSGFIRQLENGASGFVEQIELSFFVKAESFVPT